MQKHFKTIPKNYGPYNTEKTKIEVIIKYQK